MPRSGVGPLPRPGHPRLIRQPGATPLTKNKIKTQAKTAMNPHGSVVAVFDVAELVPVSVVVVAVLVVVAVVVSVVVSIVVSVVVLMVWSSWPSWWSSRWSSQLLSQLFSRWLS
ncbi:unnamed protein product [Prorocentrum cordatum]|uniref:Uncharacterized protein n=1 Tax=Prorocentrum cordatum TaxID=2364126 RepID=A0ABN9UIZ6_9DINO|nr:unnamed protein product [Polarella glacialis]